MQLRLRQAPAAGLGSRPWRPRVLGAALFHDRLAAQPGHEQPVAEAAPYTTAMGARLRGASEPLGRLIRNPAAGPTPGVSESVGVG